MSENKRIAKNTLFMYIRMILIMLVTIYTSRVILDKLGVVDYGLYNAIASVVAIVVFMTDTLSTTTSRFITYDLGNSNANKLSLTFSTSFYTHILLAIIIIVLMETGGVWYMSNKFVIPVGKEYATMIVFQISIILMAVTIIMVPYIGLITAHEDLSIYACVGMFEAVASLIIVYLLNISPRDRLICYALLLLLVKLIVACIYVIICIKIYPESKLTLAFNQKKFKRMINFLGWTAIANLSNTFTIQGAIILLNIFFSPIVIVSKALSDQITAAVLKFVSNFRVALNPQIIKSQAEGNEDRVMRMTLKSSLVSFDLVLILGLPCYFTMDSILDAWLIEVPNYAASFARVAIISQIIGVLSTSTYIPFIASGKLKSNAIYGLIIGILFFIVLYSIFKMGGEAIWAQYMYLISSFINVLIIRPYLLFKEVNYSLKEVFTCYYLCLKVFVATFAMGHIISLFSSHSAVGQIVLFCLVTISGIFCSYYFLDKEMKLYLHSLIKIKVHIK